MRMIATMADRMLSAVAPKATAAACIDSPANTYKNPCGCICTYGQKIQYYQSCVTTCFGGDCGPCTASSTHCGGTCSG
jgi:hypothetical protein